MSDKTEKEAASAEGIEQLQYIIVVLLRRIVMREIDLHLLLAEARAEEKREMQYWLANDEAFNDVIRTLIGLPILGLTPEKGKILQHIKIQISTVMSSAVMDCELPHNNGASLSEAIRDWLDQQAPLSALEMLFSESIKEINSRGAAHKYWADDMNKRQINPWSDLGN